jgi:hypothetical protein
MYISSREKRRERQREREERKGGEREERDDKRCFRASERDVESGWEALNPLTFNTLRRYIFFKKISGKLESAQLQYCRPFDRLILPI